MTIRDDARQEAERQYPALNPGDVELTYPRGALRATARKAFERGAVWASERADRDERVVRFLAMATPMVYQAAIVAVREMTRLLDAEHLARRDCLTDREPSDAEVEAGAEAMREQGPGNTPIWDDWVWHRFARAALLAAQEVRDES